MTTEGHTSNHLRPSFSSLAQKTTQKIALEEAVGTRLFNATTTLPAGHRTGELPYVDHGYVADLGDRLFNVNRRLEAMDRAGVDLAILSLAMPGTA